MPSVIPQGDKLRSLRVAHGWTQLELALAAGISDRTVRNAEKGRPVRHEFVEFVATALGVTMEEIVEPTGELAAHRYWQRNVERLMVGMQRMMTDYDSSNLLDVIHRDFRIQVNGGPLGFDLANQMLGEYRDEKGVRNFVDKSHRLQAGCRAIDFELEPPVGGGDLVVLRGNDRYHLENGDSHGIRWVYVLEYERERLMRFEQFVTPHASAD